MKIERVFLADAVRAALGLRGWAASLGLPMLLACEPWDGSILWRITPAEPFVGVADPLVITDVQP